MKILNKKNLKQILTVLKLNRLRLYSDIQRAAGRVDIVSVKQELDEIEDLVFLIQAEIKLYDIPEKD